MMCFAVEVTEKRNEASKRKQQQPVPRRLHRGPGPSVRRRGEALVHVYSGATVGVARVLQDLQECPDSACACGRRNQPQRMCDLLRSDAKVRPKPVSRNLRNFVCRVACRAGSSFDTVASDGGSPPKHRRGAVVIVEVSGPT